VFVHMLLAWVVGSMDLNQKISPIILDLVETGVLLNSIRAWPPVDTF